MSSQACSTALLHQLNRFDKTTKNLLLSQSSQVSQASRIISAAEPQVVGTGIFNYIDPSRLKAAHTISNMTYDVECQKPTYTDKDGAFNQLVNIIIENSTADYPAALYGIHQAESQQFLSLPSTSSHIYRNHDDLSSSSSFATPYTSYTPSPLFDDPPNDLPELDFSSTRKYSAASTSTNTLDDFSQDFTSLFGCGQLMDQSQQLQDILLSNSYHGIVNDKSINPFYTDRQGHETYPNIRPSALNSDLPTEISESLPSTTFTSASGQSSQLTGFRNPLNPTIAIDAPIQPRTYITPSRTSRKRKATTKSKTVIEDSDYDEEEDEGKDGKRLNLKGLKAVDRKRILNTVSARKSRARKQEKFAELEKMNQELKDENEKLRFVLAVFQEKT